MSSCVKVPVENVQVLIDDFKDRNEYKCEPYSHKRNVWEKRFERIYKIENLIELSVDGEIYISAKDLDLLKR